MERRSTPGEQAMVSNAATATPNGAASTSNGSLPASNGAGPSIAGAETLLGGPHAHPLGNGSTALGLGTRWQARSRRAARRRLQGRAFMAADLLALALAYLGAALLGDALGAPPGAPLLLTFLPMAYVGLAALHGLYDRDEQRPDHGTTEDLPAIVQSLTVVVWLFLVGAWAIEGGAARLGFFVIVWTLAVALVPTNRTLLRAIARRRAWFPQNAIIVGAGDVGQLVARKILQRPSHGVNLVGFVDAEPRLPADGLEHVPRLGPPERLPELIEPLDVDRVIVAFSRATHDETVALIRSIKEYDVQVEIVPRLFEGLGTRVGVHALKGLSLVSLPPLRRPPPALAAKRTMDVVLSSVALVALAPLLAYLALRIKRDSKGPVLYRQERVGQDGQPFRVYKFRTMQLEYCRGSEFGGAAAEAAFARLMEDSAAKSEFEDSYKLSADPRITRFGRMLRRTSLDELPQLLNVLRGDLSLVGPRPITAEELPRYGDGARALLHVRPGLTGWWQINGRSQVSYPERVRLDLSYVSGWSLHGDIMILAKTVARLWSAQQDAV
jgi:exopolysaccharide biosynthesis polyprenyl glycosylphosphotransferase